MTLAKNKVAKLNGTALKICNETSEYLNYKRIIQRLDMASETSYWKIIGCTPRCEFTKYSMKRLYDSFFDKLEYIGEEDDGANFELCIVFVSSEVEIKHRLESSQI